MNPDLADIWVYLAETPLIGLTLTLLAYLCGDWISRRCGRLAALNPVLLAVAFLVAILALTNTPYATYFEGAQFVHFLLGPATVAMAVPLYGQARRLRRMLLPLAAGLLAGSVTAVLSATAIAWALGASPETLLSLAPKSVTTPIAMGIAEKTGGLASLTAILVIATGIIGAVLGPWLLNSLRIVDPATRGFAMGVAAHGIGTARAFQESEAAGAFAALAMGLNALATALLVPWLVGTLLSASNL